LSKEEEVKEGEILRTIRHYLVGNTAYGETGIRDVHLELKAKKIGNRLGNLHFIRFPTNQMEMFLALCVNRKLHTLTFQVFACGGGAFKFEDIVKERLNIGWNKCDEMDMLIQGVQFLNEINVDRECYYFEIEPRDPLFGGETEAEYKARFTNCLFKKMNFCFSDSYPYILVNIGSGVSILLVNSETDYKRISGTSIGGGTFLGLCCLLTGCHTYEEAIHLASKGDSTKVDKLVRDIYGGDYSKFGLPGDIVASR
jgi:type II pantothenate kinase